MKEETYYLVIARRYGDTQGHSYALSLTKDRILGKLIGWDHHYYRGNKYDPEIQEVKLRPQEKYFLFEHFNGDRNNLEAIVCHNQEEVEFLKRHSEKEKFEVTELIPDTSLPSDEAMLGLHSIIHFSMFDEEDQAYLRNLYETYIRKTLIL